MRADAIFIAAVMSATAMAGTAVEELPNVGAVRSQIFRLLNERRDAFYRGDIDKFAELETEDFTRISEDGELITRTQQLAYLREVRKKWAGARKSIAYADDELAIDLVGDVAILTGRLTETEPGQAGNATRQQSRFTEVWAFRQGHWKTLHNHYTTISP